MEGKSMAGRPARLDHTQVLYPAYSVANVPRVPTEIWKSREYVPHDMVYVVLNEIYWHKEKVGSKEQTSTTTKGNPATSD